LESRVSIPLWFDWKKEELLYLETRCRVSIPLWFDWKVREARNAVKLTDVSIPLWFDWKAGSRVFECKHLAGFNSTLVRLEEYLLITASISSFLFQFHFGSIGRFDTSDMYSEEVVFQFHFGSIGRQVLRLICMILQEFQFHFGSIGRSVST